LAVAVAVREAIELALADSYRALIVPLNQRLWSHLGSTTPSPLVLVVLVVAVVVLVEMGLIAF
jgi:hypothetical protein